MMPRMLTALLLLGGCLFSGGCHFAISFGLGSAPDALAEAEESGCAECAAGVVPMDKARQAAADGAVPPWRGETTGGESAVAPLAETSVAAETARAETAAPDPFQEFGGEDVIFVVSDPTLSARLKEAIQDAYIKAYEKAGPGGKTLLLVTDPDATPERIKDLYQQFLDERMYYAEETHAGRLYVFGLKASHERFREDPHLTYARTYMGAGPEGMSVVIEVDPERPGMVDRLIETFTAKHGITLD